MSELPPAGAGPFEVLGVERRYDIDPRELERRWLELSRAHHPDHAGEDPGARARATLDSARIHEAYGILREPDRRAEWLLRDAGGPSAEEDKSVPEGFLEDMLELRMAVEEARAEGGEARDALESRFRSAIDDVRSGIAEHMPALLARPASTEACRQVRALLNEAAYHRRLLGDLLEDSED